MCFRKLFHKPDFQRNNRVLLTFAINNYPGSGNDLQGCLNDQANVIHNLPDFQIRAFSDGAVTRANFLEACEEAVTEAVAGDMIVIHYSGHGTQVRDDSGTEADGYCEALYLYDGALIDKEIHAVLDKIAEGVTVCLLMDSCFSGGVTRNPVRSRFVQTEPTILTRRVSSFEDVINWIVISGCGENQTSADAEINGLWNGAFTFYAMYVMDRADTYKQWFSKIRMCLPNAKFDQSPTIDGPDHLLNKLILT